MNTDAADGQEPIQTNDAIKQLPEPRSFKYLVCLLITIMLDALNLGYALSYLTLSIDTIFETLEITEEERTFRLSILNGVAPVGACVGCLITTFLQRKMSNLHLMYFADLAGVCMALTLVPNYEMNVIFRFFLGFHEGINSIVMPNHLKQMCPEQYYSQFSMGMGYLTSIGLLIGQLMGAGYLSYRGKGSYWWMAVFMFPPIVSIVRAGLLFVFFHFESPEQLVRYGRDQEAIEVIKKLYKDEDVQLVFDKLSKRVHTHLKHLKFSRIFTDIRHQRTIIIGVMAYLVQQWCGSFAVFYYGAQINQQLAQGDLTLVTVFTIAVGLSMFFPMFLNIPLSRKFGVKLMMQWGSFIAAAINIGTVVFSSLDKEDIWLIMTLVCMLMLIACFSMILQPNSWSLATQLNEPDGAWFAMVCRWGIHMTLIFSFPFMIENIKISGTFIIFASVCLLHGFFVMIFVKDLRGMTQHDIQQWYSRKNYSQVVANNDEPDDQLELPQNQVELNEIQERDVEQNNEIQP